MDWQQIVAWAAAAGIAVTAVKNATTIGKWLYSPVQWIRDMLRAKHTNALLVAENERLVEENVALKAENLSFQARVTELMQRLDDRERWVTHTTKGGGVVLRDKEYVGPPEEALYRCTYCAQDGKPTFLQPKSANRFLHCPTHGDVNFQSDGSMKISKEALRYADLGTF